MPDHNVRGPVDPAKPPLSTPLPDGNGQHVPQPPPAAHVRPSEVVLFLRWMVGAALVIACGWGLVGTVFYFTRHRSAEIAVPLALGLSFVLFYLLEHDLWLSRLMGLRVARTAPRIKSTLVLWLGGCLALAVLLMRTTGGTAEAHAAAAGSGTTPERPKTEVPQTDSTREIAETVVFVVVLVLLLKTFVAEAFVIPTGSMATTLWGYQKVVVCPKCGYEFPVNCSDEVERKPPLRVKDCTCPNCRYLIDFRMEEMDPSCNTGDRVLVAKCLNDTRLTEYRPLDVVVFKFPEEPQENFVPMNYIKRLIGLPRQTIGIWYGDVYVADGDVADSDERRRQVAAEESDLPPRRQDHRNQAKETLEKGKSIFKILRKPPDKILAEQRIVYDNDYPARDVKAPRWSAEKNWKADAAHGFAHPASASPGLDWLRYRNLLRDNDNPQLITDFLGYNSGRGEGPLDWVGDLILECDVKVEQVGEPGELRLELSKGVDRFQARVQLSTGVCKLVRIKADGEEELESRPTKIKKAGDYHVRFANVDQRLTLWVDSDLPFDDGRAYDAPARRGPTEANDLEPASIGVAGAGVQVRHLRLWRDTYYTYWSYSRFAPPPGNKAPDTFPSVNWAEPSTWAALDKLPAMTFYVQPGHYFCMGDNSAQSSDSRSWGARRNPMDDSIGGLVPEQLMLGRALMIYYPVKRFGRIE